MFESILAPTPSFRALQSWGNETVVDEAYTQTISEVVLTPLYLGLACVGVSMICFSIAVHCDWIEELAPRAANRPRVIMRNAIQHGLPEKFKNKLFIYPFALMHWSYNLTYKELLGGIPGTGTRKNGEEGPLLKVNLDGVIWLRFETLLFKIGLLVAILCMFVLIPINETATCDREIFGNGTCAYHDSLSGFARTTIAHIPVKVFNDDVNKTVEVSVGARDIFNSVINRNQSISVTTTEPDGSVTVCTNTGTEGLGNTSAELYSNETSDLYSNLTIDDDGDDIRRYLNSQWHERIIRMLNDSEDNDDDANGENADGNTATGLSTIWVPGQSWRMLTTCLCCILIYVYTMYLLWHEWASNVALRRAFFLEASHYGQRMTELNKLDLDLSRGKVRGNTAAQEEYSYPPYLTHPEVRETPPSINLFSVLYQLPKSMVTYGTDGANPVERQLVATKKFFEMIIPPQPGFSSSVIAVTMIPNAKLVANVQTRWDKVETSLQSLRHIRRLLEKKSKKKSKNWKKEDGAFPSSSSVHDNKEKTKTQSVQVVYGDMENLQSEPNEVVTDEPASSEMSVFKYENFCVKAYARSLGLSDEVDKISLFVDGMGIEEFNVFVYNCALLEGTLGLNKSLLNSLSKKKLEKKQKEMEDELDIIHQELIDAREAVITRDDAEKDSGKNILKPARLIDTNDEWRAAETEVEEALTASARDPNKGQGIGSGINSFFKRVLIGPEMPEFDPKHYGVQEDKEGRAFETNMDHPSYAVITFASRHSAIVARQCLADGVAANNWMQVKDLPIYPLAEAPPLSLFYTRGYMLPVTPTISYASKKIRRWLVFIFLIVFIGSYTALLNVLNNFLWNPENYKNWGISDEFLSQVLPTLSGLTQTLLFTVCPFIFKFVANKSGEATSYESGEQLAMIYFWYFYLVVRYLGQLVVQSFNKLTQPGDDGASIEKIVVDALSELASTAPTILGPFALTYIIFAATVTWPIIYFLQLNNFLTSWLRLGYLNRLLKGGGPGAELPFRIYVDSGWILSAMTTLAPVCPLIGPFALLYYVALAPMLRFLVVFAYRPKFDSGGGKWPTLHHIVISSLVLGQVLNSFTFLLKGNYIAGSIILACVIPTLLFNSIVLEKFKRPFSDASLHFTGRLQQRQVGAQENEDRWKEREEFRRWLVDCHKASYVPTCMSGGDKNLLTAEPALTIPIVRQPVEESAADYYRDQTDKRSQFSRQVGQKGGDMRRQRFGI